MSGWGLLTAEAWAGGTLTLGSHVFTQGDSLHIELLLNLSDAKAGNAEAYLFTPVLRGAGRLQELPAVVVSGRRRARADQRQQALQPSPRLFASLPYALYPKPERQYYL